MAQVLPKIQFELRIVKEAATPNDANTQQSHLAIELDPNQRSSMNARVSFNCGNCTSNHYAALKFVTIHEGPQSPAVATSQAQALAAEPPILVAEKPQQKPATEQSTDPPVLNPETVASQPSPTTVPPPPKRRKVIELKDVDVDHMDKDVAEKEQEENVPDFHGFEEETMQQQPGAKQMNGHAAESQDEEEGDEIGSEDSVEDELEEGEEAENGLDEDDKENDEQFPCSLCDKICPTKPALRAHNYTRHTPKVMSCAFCETDFTCTKAEFDNHLRAKHPENAPAKETVEFGDHYFPCAYCERKVFRTFDRYETHVTGVHNKEFLCDKCNRAYYTRSNLAQHVRIQHFNEEEAAFVCKTCKKRFASERGLNLHSKIHLDKEFRCVLCNHTFEKEPGLMKHIKKHHFESKQEYGSGDDN